MIGNRSDRLCLLEDVLNMVKKVLLIRTFLLLSSLLFDKTQENWPIQFRTRSYNIPLRYCGHLAVMRIAHRNTRKYTFHIFPVFHGVKTFHHLTNGKFKKSIQSQIRNKLCYRNSVKTHCESLTYGTRRDMLRSMI